MLKSYNNFTTGESQDDFLTAGGRLIETFGVTGLRDGHGLTLGAKTNKQLLTNGQSVDIHIGGNETSSFAFGLNGEIYRLDSDDLTPVYTHTLGYAVVGYFVKAPYGYFITKNVGTINIMRETLTNIQNGTFATVEETWGSPGGNDYNPPLLTIGDNRFLGLNSAVYMYDSALTGVNYEYFDDYVVGLTLHGGTFLVYTSGGKVFFWNGLDSSDASFSNRSQGLGFNPRKVVQIAGIDYVTTDDGQLYIGGGSDFSLVTYKKQTIRGNDNTQYITKQDFTPDINDGQMLAVARDRLYLATSGLYEYGNLFPGLSKGLFKTVVYNNSGIVIDKIYCVKYNSLNKRLLFSYKAGTTYGIDYIDLDSKETNADGYAVTEVFAGYNEGIITFLKKLQALRYTTMNTNGDNYIELYKRINNGTWELVKNINEDISTIKHKDLRTEKDEFLDIQFKIVFHNDDKGIYPPILPGLEIQYETLPI